MTSKGNDDDGDDLSFLLPRVLGGLANPRRGTILPLHGLQHSDPVFQVPSRHGVLHPPLLHHSPGCLYQGSLCPQGGKEPGWQHWMLSARPVLWPRIESSGSGLRSQSCVFAHRLCYTGEFLVFVFCCVYLIFSCLYLFSLGLFCCTLSAMLCSIFFSITICVCLPFVFVFYIPFFFFLVLSWYILDYPVLSLLSVTIYILIHECCSLLFCPLSFFRS